MDGRKRLKRLDGTHVHEQKHYQRLFLGSAPRAKAALIIF